MTMPRVGHGTLLQVGDGATPTELFTTIARIVEIGEFGGDVDDIEITNHDSAFAVREYVRGLAEPGEISGTGIWIGDATQLDVYSGVFAGIGPNQNFKVILAGSLGTALFSGYFAAFRLSPPLDNRIEFSFRIKLSGSYTLSVP